MELWGGVECTINRVGDSYLRQLERSGHLARLDDLDRFAGLGIGAIRYPVLWEQHAPNGEDERGEIDWTWADARLGRLRALGVRPIVGLVHHGSGPARTSLVDPAFATGLAAYARLVAERFPWVDDWTPVNEPLTTARFSGLYGVWYPHGRDPRAFGRAIVTQCRAVQLAMREIRAVNPAARLVQTEDLGRIFATPPLAAEAELHNERRWLGFDLLCGRVGPEHPFWPILLRWGIAARELDEFREAPCVPDVMGINHYLCSDRFLDHRVERYPDRAIDYAGMQFGDRPLRAPLRDPDASSVRPAGDDGGTPFVDVEAVRVSPDVTVGVGPRLREAWVRYGLPLAVTESHLGCTREEQMRWLLETWRSAHAVHREGVDVRAVTVWSLLGAFDWNTLVTRDDGFYEPGPFDVRGPTPRPTALATLTRQLARGIEPDHPVLEQPGWWRRPERLFHRAPEGRACMGPGPESIDMRHAGSRPLVITGASGTLGSGFARMCDMRGIPYRLLTRREVEMTDGAAVHAAIAALRPWAVVHCAGWARVDDAEHEADACRAVNVDASAALAAACARVGAQLVAFSSDLVFDGVRRLGPYVESDTPSPLGVYGQSKAEMETRVLGLLPDALVVRTSAFFGPWDADDFVTTTLRALAAGATVEMANDIMISPTYLVDLVNTTLDLLIDGADGIWHLVNEGAVTWAELARLAAERADIPSHGVRPRPVRELHLRAPRPRYSALRSERARLMPGLDDALTRYVRHRAEAGGSIGTGETRRELRPRRYHQAAGRL